MAYNFPDSPTVGQGYSGYVYDGEKWLAIAGAPNQSGVISIQVFTLSGTYVPSPNMTTCMIECYGGGGGGGGAAAAAAGANSAGGGGGGGSYARITATAGLVGTSLPVVIGAAGAGGTLGATAGSIGGTTTVGTLLSAGGGNGGGAGTALAQITAILGGAGGLATIGTVRIPGSPGGSSFGQPGIALAGASGGASGNGSGGAYAVFNADGAAATGYGGGGGGGCSGASNPARVGGAGAPGLVVITEYGMIALSSSNAQGMVRFDLPQSLTANQTAQARANIAVTKKNYIINGGMMVSQENGTATATTDNYWPVDMFKMGFGNAGTQVTGQIASVTPAGSPNRLIVGCNAIDASVGATDNLQIIHIIEGLRTADLMFGTASAKTITVQFGVKAPAGTYCLAVSNGGNTRNYVSEYIITAGEANTDVTRSITVPGDVTGTWLKDNSTGIVLHWVLMCGATYQQAAGSWGTVPSGMATANQYNFLSNNTNNFYLFDVSLTEGNVAPPFQLPDYATELALCQRYFYRGCPPLRGVMSTTTNADRMACRHPVPMRGAPQVTMPAAIAVYDGGGLSAVTAVPSNYSTADTLEVVLTVGTALTALRPASVYQTAGSLSVNARL